jgi:hypothetical protein
MPLRMAACLAVACLPALAHAQLPLPPRVPPVDPLRSCLHQENETAGEAARRTEALAAMRMIDYALQDRLPRAYPRWEDFSDLPVVARLRAAPGPAGELARKIAWGAPEPLPGWGIAYVLSDFEVRFSLTDMRDPCGFTYSSRDPNVMGRRMRIVPLT